MGSTSTATESPASSGSRRTHGSASAATSVALCVACGLCTLDATRTLDAKDGMVFSSRALARAGTLRPPSGTARNRR